MSVVASISAQRLEPSFEAKPWGRRDGFRGPAGCVPLGEIVFADRDPELIVKWIQTDAALSVQSHPQEGAGERKNEWWYVAEARPDAYLLLGLKQDVSAEQICAAAHDGSIVGLLHRVIPRAGDAFFVPAGTIHAIGPGLTLLEVQEPSTTTFRLYDYGRDRSLHLREAVRAAVLRGVPEPEPTWPDWPFAVHKVEIAAGGSVKAPAGCYAAVVSGSAMVGGQKMKVGECWRVCAGAVFSAQAAATLVLAAPHAGQPRQST